MKRALTISATAAVLGLLAAFQNCGGKFASQAHGSAGSSQNSSSSSTIVVTGGGPGVTGQAQNVQVNPGDPIDLALTLSNPATQDLNFTYQTSDDTALSGQHYVATAGSGVIPAGQAVGHIAIATINNPGLIYLGRDFKVTIVVPSISVNQVVTVTFKSGLETVVLKNTWTTISAVGAPTARSNAASVWTGSKVLIFGGSDGPALAGGYSYDPTLDKWATLSSVGAPSARMFMAYGWTGTQMIVWGGQSQPGTDTNTGALYNPATDTWKTMSTVGAPSARYTVDRTAAWTGTTFVVWGGINSGFVAGGALYDPILNSWEAINATGAPGARSENAIVWTGSKILVWGGLGALGNGNNGVLANGAAYDPVTKTWSTISAADAPTARASPEFAWTGTKMIVWGGGNNTGAVYDPATDTWSAMSASPLAGRTEGVAQWTGKQLLIIGGAGTAGGFLSDGASYQ